MFARNPPHAVNPRSTVERRPSVRAARPADGREPRYLGCSRHNVVSTWNRLGLHQGQYFRRRPEAWHTPLPGEPALPEPQDVRQKDLADCWFLAALASYAAVNPRGVRDRITALPGGRFQVRLWEAVEVGPDLYLPDWTWRGHADWGPESGTWAALFEKAAAKLRTSPGKRANYRSLMGGNTELALQMLGYLGATASVDDSGKVTDGSFARTKDGLAHRFAPSLHYPIPSTVKAAWNTEFRGRDVVELAGELAWDGRIVVLGTATHAMAVLPGRAQGTADLYDQANGRRSPLTPQTLPPATTELTFSLFPAC